MQVREFLTQFLYPTLDVPEHHDGVFELTKILCNESQEFELSYLATGQILKVTRQYTASLDRALLDSNFFCSFEVYKQTDEPENLARIVFGPESILEKHYGVLNNNMGSKRIDISVQLMFNMLLVKASKSLDYDMLLWVRDNVCDMFVRHTHPTIVDLLTYCLSTHKPITSEGTMQ